MGSSCSAPAKEGDEGKGSVSRQSFTSVRLGKGLTVVKPGNEYGQLYVVGQRVGKDEGVVSAVKNENEVEYVSRAIEKREMPVQDMNSVQDYFGVLASLDHLHICRFLEAFDNGERINMIYEKANPTTIFESEDALRASKPLNQELAQLYCRQIASALRVAHKTGVVHGRLGESSLLQGLAVEDEERNVKICDFGQTFVARGARANALDYTCPQMVWEELSMPPNLTSFRSNIKAYQSTDCWALGVLLFRMLTGKLPFAGKKGPDLKEAIKSSTITFGKDWDKMPDAREVVHGLLKNAWRIRLTADRVLNHPWICLSKARLKRGRMMRVLQNVMLNTSESTFKKFTLRVIAEEMSPEKLDIIQAAFSNLDKNGDGNLEVEEIRAALKKYGEEEAIADEIFEAIDRDASGTLNFAEFTAVSLGHSEYSNREALFHAFQRFDRDGNGTFEREEICRVLKEVDHLNDTSGLDAEVEEIAKDIVMPMDFHSFVQHMTTPAGQPVSNMTSGWNRLCAEVFKADVHGIRHVEPKSGNAGGAAKTVNPLFQPIYRTTHYSPSNAETTSRRSKRA